MRLKPTKECQDDGTGSPDKPRQAAAAEYSLESHQVMGKVSCDPVNGNADNKNNEKC